MSTERGQPRIAVVTLGCARDEVDSEELAGELDRRGCGLVEPDEADAELGFDHCSSLADRLDDVLAGRSAPVHQPQDRCTMPIGPVQVLLEGADERERARRAEHRGPEVDGECMVLDPGVVAAGEVLSCRVVGTEGVALVVRPDAQGRDRAGVV